MVHSVLKKCSPFDKPQSGFQRVLAENSYNQFKHLMLPHEVVGDCENLHPYKEEIEELSKNLKTEFVELFDGEVKKIEDTECVWVETTEQLEQLAEVLSRERVFGVDTEQDCFRSFLGFTALIQISTKSKDYLVDTIALHDEMSILRPVFANPRICKVFHGAIHDVVWLQRDFHIYVVNIFDTGKASSLLWKQVKSFAYLVDKYFKVSKNITLTRRDWTPRPLSAEMVEYARIDSHFLLPVANCLVSELRKESTELVIEAIRCSNKSCLKLYKKDTKEAYLGESAAASIISGYNKKNPERFHYKDCDKELLGCHCISKFQRIVRRLCGWRQIMARVHDESLSFILSNEAIGAIASTLPVTETYIRETICRADDSASPSHVVCSHFEDFGMLIFPDRAAEDDDFGHTIVQRCLGSNGNCSSSVYNFNLLSDDTIPKLSNKPGLNMQKSDQKKSTKSSGCKNPVYDNARVIGEDGRFLWYCSQRKKKLYLKRGWAKLVEGDHDTIMYVGGRIYEHKPNGYKQNTCVGCGEGENYSRYRIIPVCYLKWFPEHMNKRQEMVLLCKDCYAIIDVAVVKCKQEIAEEFGIPVHQCKRYLKSCHGRLVVEHILENKGEDGIHEFCHRWRQVFVDAIHLP